MSQNQFIVSPIKQWDLGGNYLYLPQKRKKKKKTNSGNLLDSAFIVVSFFFFFHSTLRARLISSGGY